MTRKSLRILYVTPYVPASVRVRPNRFIQHLAKKHRITTVCLAQPAWESKYIGELYHLCEAVYPVFPSRFVSYMRCLAALPTPIPLSVAFCASARVRMVIRHVLQHSEFDLVHTEFIRAAQYTADIQGTPKLYDAVDSMSLAYNRACRNRYGGFLSRALACEESLKMRFYEPRMIRHFDRVIVSSPADQASLSLDHGPLVDVVPNGVDLEYFQWDSTERAKDSIVFVGKMNYYVNVDGIKYFCQCILPKIRMYHSKVRLSVVGWNPTRTVRALAKDPAIEVTGSVPDIRPFLTRAAVFVCPLLSGAGIQNKVLQAMAIGTPVVTTPLACQSLAAEPGRDLLVADEPAAFAEAVLRLLEDAGLRARLARNARRYVEEHHDWGQIGDRLEAIYHDVLG